MKNAAWSLFLYVSKTTQPRSSSTKWTGSRTMLGLRQTRSRAVATPGPCVPAQREVGAIMPRKPLVRWVRWAMASSSTAPGGETRVNISLARVMPV